MFRTYGSDVVTLDRLGEDYPFLLQHVRLRGDLVASRIGGTREVRDLSLRIRYPLHALIDRPGMSETFAYEEIAQLLAGVHDNERLAAIVPLAAELIATPTAYGPRVWPQLEHVCAELESSPASRRAVVYVGRHDDLGVLMDPDESIARAGEMPCTCLWQFAVRDGKLRMSVYMRSWDLVWGLSYDVPSFVSVQAAVAAHLGVDVGDYYHTAGSAHVYERHWDLIPGRRTDALDLEPFLESTIQGTRERAQRILATVKPTSMNLLLSEREIEMTEHLLHR